MEHQNGAIWNAALQFVIIQSFGKEQMFVFVFPDQKEAVRKG